MTAAEDLLLRILGDPDENMPPQDRLGEMFRFAAGNLAAMGGQPPEVSNGDRIMADVLAWRMANNPGT